MKAAVTPEAENAIADIAQRHGLSREAVLAMLFAMRAGGGTMAQFSIPELGGSGQWMRGEMTMVGNMFDNALKARVDALCGELAQLLATTTVFPASTTDSPAVFGSANWWPAAIFPSTRRQVLQINGVTRVFDTGEHQIGGVQQQQGGRPGSVGFTSQFGTFDISSLTELGTQQVAETPAPAPAPQYRPEPAPQVAPQTRAPEPAAGASGDPTVIVAAIESLAGLHQRGILSDEEFTTKKAELLGRL